VLLEAEVTCFTNEVRAALESAGKFLMVLAEPITLRETAGLPAGRTLRRFLAHCNGMPGEIQMAPRVVKNIGPQNRELRAQFLPFVIGRKLKY
jgi:hypothetical protein